MTEVLIVVASIFVLLLFWGSYEKKSKTKRIEAAFTGRRQLDEGEFYQRYFKAQGVPPGIVVGIRRILEENLEADLSRLTDGDDFSRNLNFFWDYDSMAGCIVVAALEKEFGIEISDDEAQAMRTVRDIVETVWGKVRERAA
jgi:acyl carrier protein